MPEPLYRCACRCGDRDDELDDDDDDEFDSPALTESGEMGSDRPLTTSFEQMLTPKLRPTPFFTAPGDDDDDGLDGDPALGAEVSAGGCASSCMARRDFSRNGSSYTRQTERERLLIISLSLCSFRSLGACT